MSHFIVPTRFTVEADVHTVSMCLTVSPHISVVFPVKPLWFFSCLSPGNPGSLSLPEVACWICLINAATVLVRSANGLILWHHCLYIFCCNRCKVDEGILRPIHLLYVIHAMVFPRACWRFLLPLLLLLHWLEVCLEVCPGFLVPLLIVPLVPVIVE